MKKFSDFLKENEFVSAKIMSGPNGDFIIAQQSDDSITYFPVGRKSQGVVNIFEYNCMITDDGQAIATINQYTDVTDMVKL
jgi:hypothetical protein